MMINQNTYIATYTFILFLISSLNIYKILHFFFVMHEFVLFQMCFFEYKDEVE